MDTYGHVKPVMRRLNLQKKRWRVGGFMKGGFAKGSFVVQGF
jgi:hypothetical protein